MFSPGLTLRVISTCLPRSEVYSTMTTASAPAGTGAPVMMDTVCPLAMAGRDSVELLAGFDFADYLERGRELG